MRKLMVLLFSPSLDRDVLSIFKRVMSSRTIEEVRQISKGVGWTPIFGVVVKRQNKKRTTKKNEKKKKEEALFLHPQRVPTDPL